MSWSNDSDSMLRHALALQSAGRLADAEAAYMQLLARWPGLADSWYNLALLQRRAGRFEAALASYQQALDRGVSCPEEVHLNRGVIYSDCLRQEAAAERELNAALALNPDYVPALLNLANLREDLGNRDAALALYEKILALQPDYHEALARYASVKAVRNLQDPLQDPLKDPLHDPVIGRLRQAIADDGTTPADKASLGFALGKALDGCGAYDDAFEAYAMANLHSRHSVPGAIPYDRRQHELYVDRLIAAFDRSMFDRSMFDRSMDVPDAGAAARPIFICGMFRSGSTLTEQMLARHSRVRAGGEIDFLPSLAHTRLAPFPAGMTSATPQQLELLAQGYLAMLSKTFPGADHVTDKRPDNFLYIGLIKRLFPHARIIHTTRNALDNCLSIFFLHLDHSMGYALDLLDTAHYYGQYRRLMSHWQSLYGADILDFSYDVLVNEPRPALQRLLAFCELDWEEGCMSFQHTGNSVRTASVWQVREPLYQRSSGRWQNYAAHLVPLRDYLADYLRTGDAGVEQPATLKPTR